ncbi:Uncharacterised protein [Chlamydia trachomatis]|nr:Uncharacterised protein [Chlamydia trachomatis]
MSEPEEGVDLREQTQAMQKDREPTRHGQSPTDKSFVRQRSYVTGSNVMLPARSVSLATGEDGASSSERLVARSLDSGQRR